MEDIETGLDSTIKGLVKEELKCVQESNETCS